MKLRVPSARQLDLLFGRVLRLPPDHDASFDAERVTFQPVTVFLSPAQATWMGVETPKVTTCPGCILFGCCAIHDSEDVQCPG